MEILYRLKHYLRKIGLTFWGPAQLDDEHDPLKVEDREYRAHEAAYHAEHDRKD